MKKLLLYLIIIFSLSLMLLSGYQGYRSSFAIYWIISGSSLLLSTCTFTLTAYNSKTVHWITILLALSLIVQPWFVEYLRWLTFIVGLVAAVFLMFTIRLMPTVKNFILHAQDGATLMEIKKLEFKDGNLIVKGKMMGTMPTVAQMRPEEIWKALSMMPLGVLLGFPAYLYKAWKSKGEQPSKQTNTIEY